MLTSAMTTKEVIKDIIRKRNLMDTPDWTLFELCNDFGVGKFFFFFYFYVIIFYPINIINIIILY